jgi:hypothetical protein
MAGVDYDSGMSTGVSEPTLENDPAVKPSRVVSGRRVVIGMFLFGGGLVALMYVYWEFYTRPFRPLQYAIAAEFPKSLPRVIGGRHKSHQANSPNILRVVVRVDFNPEEEAASAERERLTSRLAELTAEHVNVFDYDQLEIHLVHRVPEEKTQQWSKVGTPEEWGFVQGASGPPGPGQEAK